MRGLLHKAGAGVWRVALRVLRAIGVGGKSARTVKKSGAGFAAKKKTEAAAGPHGAAERAPPQPRGVLFKRLARPELVERTAAELTLEQAQTFAAQSTPFYVDPFALFPRTDFFYEEVEEEYLKSVLAKTKDAADANFLSIMGRFRRALNDNTRRLFLIYAPLLAILVIVAERLSSPRLAAVFAPAVANAGVRGSLAPLVLADCFFIGLGVLVLLLIYHWPYKVTQQQNLLGLDNYITSKFSRINHNFQVAKRKAMNVERGRRMPEADQLKQEAGDWTVAYHWLAMRLLLCELTVRNVVYQIKRNTALYDLTGVLIAGAAAIALVSHWSDARPSFLIEAAGSAAVFIGLAYFSIMSAASRDMLAVLQPKEWNRFHRLTLDETVRDHVGEDKVQIVTFRDRNRFE
ncbi:MAG: hypothetical protein AAF224_01920 [Pseudomonadota bacterium]